MSPLSAHWILLQVGSFDRLQWTMADAHLWTRSPFGDQSGDGRIAVGGAGDQPTHALSIVSAVSAILLTMSAVLNLHPTHAWSLNHTFLALSLYSSVAFMLLANTLFIWEPTRSAGQVLVTRVTRVVENWEKETLRSFIELGIWLGDPR